MSQTPSRVCSIADCDGKPIGWGWCSKHYYRWKRHGDPLAPTLPVGMTTEQRFWHYVDRSDADGHWMWTGPSTSPDTPAWNYGRLTISAAEQEPDGPRTVLAHRYAWELLVGPIPDDREIDHVCRVTLCVRPEPLHLEPVTHVVNMRRGDLVQVPERRGTCRRGHPYSFKANGNRYCPTCTRAAGRAASRRARTRAGRLLDVGAGGAQRAKTHCPQGHPYDAENTYVPPKRPNARQCRTCTGRRPASTQGALRTHCKHGHELTADNVRMEGSRRRCLTCERERSGRRTIAAREGREPVGNAAKTHCKRGHPLSGDNLYVQSSGSRACLTCKRAKSLEAYYRKRSGPVTT